MNETIRAILGRRSVRSYTSEQIKPDELDLILKAGLYAPSSHNQQPWHFTVVQDKELIDEMSAAAKRKMVLHDDEFLKSRGGDENFHIFYHCPTIIVVSGKKTAMNARSDCSSATANMLVAAESMNIGTCWIGLVGYLFRSDEGAKYAKLLNIPEGYEPFYALTAGYKTEPNREAPARRENTVNFVK